MNVLKMARDLRAELINLADERDADFLSHTDPRAVEGGAHDDIAQSLRHAGRQLAIVVGILADIEEDLP